MVPSTHDYDAVTSVTFLFAKSPIQRKLVFVFMRRPSRLILTAALWAPLALAADPFAGPAADLAPTLAVTRPPAELLLVGPPARARMSPDLALAAHQQRLAHQATTLAGYTAHQVVEAALPGSAQSGRYQLTRRYSAPRSLAFQSLGFTGDGFVKSNVIHRLLQSEVEHVERDKGSETAISVENYKFSYQGVEQLESASVYVFQVKPRKKRPGLFKGRIYLDVFSGSLRRAQGRLVKSPSFFVRQVDFVRDYVDVEGFTFPARFHSEAKVRLVGRVLVDIALSQYHPAFVVAAKASGPSAGSPNGAQ